MVSQILNIYSTTKTKDIDALARHS